MTDTKQSEVVYMTRSLAEALGADGSNIALGVERVYILNPTDPARNWTLLPYIKPPNVNDEGKPASPSLASAPTPAPAIPPYLRDGLERYRDSRIPTGGFLRAVLSNDLSMAMQTGMPESLAALKAVHDWLMAEMPARAWGSRRAVKQWLDRTGNKDEEVG